MKRVYRTTVLITTCDSWESMKPMEDVERSYLKEAVIRSGMIKITVEEYKYSGCTLNGLKAVLVRLSSEDKWWGVQAKLCRKKQHIWRSGMKIGKMNVSLQVQHQDSILQWHNIWITTLKIKMWFWKIKILIALFFQYFETLQMLDLIFSTSSMNFHYSNMRFFLLLLFS